MKRFFLIVISAFLLSSLLGVLFGSVSRSGQVGNKFYNYLKTNDYKSIVSLLDKKALNNITEKEWINILKERNELIGNSFEYKNIGFHTSTVNKNNITQLDYTINNNGEIIYESIDLIKREGSYKIIDYRFNKMYSKKHSTLNTQ